MLYLFISRIAAQNHRAMEERFNRYLSERYDKEKVLPSEVMSADKKERIMTYLTCGLADSTPSFRHMVKRKGYTIETCDGATRLIIRKTIKVKGDNVSAVVKL